jgi:hypothetical protein
LKSIKSLTVLKNLLIILFLIKDLESVENFLLLVYLNRKYGK